MSMSLYASKEEYEQAHAARWYCLDRDGVAMLCKDEADAMAQAVENDDCWPGRAPHRAVRMVELQRPLTHMQIVMLWGDRSDGPSTPEIVGFARHVERAHGIGPNARLTGPKRPEQEYANGTEHPGRFGSG